MKVISSISVYHTLNEDNTVYNYASPLTRLLCFLVEGTIFGTLIQLVIFLLMIVLVVFTKRTNYFENVVYVSFFVYFYYFIARPYMENGQSFGKEYLKLKIVDSNWDDPDLSTLLIRELIGKPLCLLTLGFGFAIAFLREDKRGLHDIISGTYIIEYKKTKQVK